MNLHFTWAVLCGMLRRRQVCSQSTITKRCCDLRRLLDGDDALYSVGCSSYHPSVATATAAAAARSGLYQLRAAAYSHN